ncbi:hypothetical protein J8I87_33090 [Paraburkholderia sp. LEh10]|uniref:hypothetical protein n=1 Tax=Paraburkholderia sp. LEh10 TaxID=2821353 RepID=UPI001AE43E5D|nr:hypothetical protein [Paraburkholderia sp. LEh10]MBP0594418.1 hypothetical protein [Paraburkholderia sp. LEh10]
MKRRNRRLVLHTLAALGLTSLRPLWSPVVAATTRPSSAARSTGRRMTEMIGSNGWPGSDSDIAMWKKMGITWARGPVGPGQAHSASDEMRVDKTGNGNGSDLPPVIIRNNSQGIHTLLLLAYTPAWNASVPGDTKSAPLDVKAWERYVEAVVRKYYAPPYNVRFFQVWNEAAGRLSGGSPQASFWHGAARPGTEDTQHAPYERAMEDYVEKIHIPAARIIRRYGAYVVYGGWPDQGGLETFSKWLEYRSPRYNQRMLDCVDYLDTHYLAVKDFDYLYERYVKQGPARGLWQTEIGDRYMSDDHYLPRYFFDFAVWALDREWNDPNKYVSMVYHWDGYEPFRLTHRGPPARTYNVSGQSLIVLNQTVGGALSRFPQKLQFGPEASGSALYSGKQIVMQVRALAGWRTVDAPGLAPPSSGRATVQFVDALSGSVSPATDTELKWDEEALRIRFNVPDHVNGHGGKGTPKHLAYLVVRPQ